MLQTSTVKESTLELLKRLQAEPLLATTRLVGGTALSLQIGHRESEDLDLFSVEPLEGMLVQQMLVDKYGFLPTVVAENTLIGFIQGVKIDVIYHPFPWLEPAIEEDGIRIATKTDIAAMKVHAIINRRPSECSGQACLDNAEREGGKAELNSGKRPKDFVDVAFLSMHYSYNQIKALLLKRYPAYDPIMADKAVIYFGDIDELLIPEIKMLGYEFDFERIKSRIIKMTDKPDKVYTTAPLKKS